MTAVIAPEGDALATLEGLETFAQQQAAATMAMRRMRAIQRDIERIEDARDLEKQAIEDMAANELRPLRARLDESRRYVETLAELMEWGRKKSHDSPYGSFGVRDSEAKLDCTDRVTLATWASKHAPQFARVEMTLPLTVAAERFSAPELAEMGELDVEWSEMKKALHPDGELPPGVVKVAAVRTPYVKVAL